MLEVFLYAASLLNSAALRSDASTHPTYHPSLANCPMFDALFCNTLHSITTTATLLGSKGSRSHYLASKLHCPSRTDTCAAEHPSALTLHIHLSQHICNLGATCIFLFHNRSDVSNTRNIIITNYNYQLLPITSLLLKNFPFQLQTQTHFTFTISYEEALVTDRVPLSRFATGGSPEKRGRSRLCRTCEIL